MLKLNLISSITLERVYEGLDNIYWDFSYYSDKPE